MFRASVIPVSKELIKEADLVLYNLICNGKDKVKRLALISDKEMGGLKMLVIQSMICTKRITCFKKLLEDYSRSLESNPRQTSVINRRTFCIALQLSNF